jgi:hypothetical protein
LRGYGRLERADNIERKPVVLRWKIAPFPRYRIPIYERFTDAKRQPDVPGRTGGEAGRTERRAEILHGFL